MLFAVLDAHENSAYHVSQAFGLVALAFAWVAVLLGLMVAAKPLSWIAIGRKTMERTHRVFTWSVIVLTFGHALFSAWEGTGNTLVGSFVPGMLHYAPGRFPMALGIVAFWMMLMLGPTYYARGWLGPKLWRSAHRFTVVVYCLAVSHALTYGSYLHFHNALRVLLGLAQVPLVAAFLWRFLSPSRASERVAPSLGD